MTIGRRAFLGASIVGVGLVCAACSSTPESPIKRTDKRTDKKVGLVKSSYGSDASQFGQLYLPDSTEVLGTVVVIHGGFWSSQYDLSLGAPLAADLAKRGWVAWNIEYRRLGNGGGWPTTFEDVAAAIDHLATLKDEHPVIDLGRVLTLGHSAGGHLGTWAAGRTDPRVPLTGIVSQAGVLELARASRESVGNGFVDQLMGTTAAADPALFARADPSAQLPVGIPVHAVHARGDQMVPFDQSSRYVAAARAAGDDATLVEVEGDHFSLIDIRSAAWHNCLASLNALR
ncbi:MAG: alpha/beta hydrolase [Nocardioidaceae bacterium]|nr:alpha/beta hydrolase [Nocardioidaceae bacterium]